MPTSMTVIPGAADHTLHTLVQRSDAHLRAPGQLGPQGLAEQLLRSSGQDVVG